MKNCPSCGTANPDDAIYCSGCAYQFEDAPPPGQPPQVLPPSQPVYPMPPGQPPYPPPGDAYYQPVYPRFAGFWIRFAAFLIDGLIISLAFLPLNVIFTALDHDIPIYFVFWGLWLSPKGVDLSLLIIFNITRLLILYAYFIVLTGRYGATYGKMILKIKVVMEDLSRVSYGKAALRETVGKWVCYISLLIGFIWIGFDSRKQGWQDKIAHTIVIYE